MHLTQQEKDIIIGSLKRTNIPKVQLDTIIEKVGGDTKSVWMKTKYKLDALIDQHAETVKSTAQRLCASRGITTGDYNHEEWAFAKVIMTAALREHCNDFFPRNTDGVRLYGEDIKNLKHF